MAIDPGSSDSAYVLVDSEDYAPVDFGKVPNDELLPKIYLSTPDKVVIERVASYGMPVGREVFDTCEWIGRFTECVLRDCGFLPEYVYRQDEKLTICHSPKANDATIRMALIDRFAKHDRKNGKGTKKDPDWFYGFKADIWSAYGVAVTYLDRTKQ